MLQMKYTVIFKDAERQYPCLRGLGIQTRQLLLNKISHLEGFQAVRMPSWWREPVRETQLGGITLAF